MGCLRTLLQISGRFCREAEPARFCCASCPGGISFLLVVFLFAGCGSDRESGAGDEGRFFPEINHMSLVFLPARIDDGGGLRPSACFVDKYEVTNGEYREFLEKSGYRSEEDIGSGRDAVGDNAPSSFDQTGGDEFPARFVNYEDAEAYAAFHGKEIPAWSDWLAAAGVTPDRPYPWGDRFVRFFCNSLRADLNGPTRVGTFESGKSPWGCYDMAGNVAEWTATVADPFQEQTGVRVHLVAGGSFNEWGYSRERDSRNIFDILHSPRKEESRNRNFSVGFRCVRRNAIPLVVEFLARLETLPAGLAAEAVRELAEAGRGMRDVLFLLDFERRSTLVRKVAGLFSIENLGDVRNGPGDEFLLKPLEGDMTVLSAKRTPNWPIPLNSSCTVTLVRDDRGRTEKVAVLENGPGCITIRNPRDGKKLWTASARGDPRSAVGIFPPGGESLLTSWIDEEAGPSPTSLLLCHHLESGRLLWEKEFDGAIVLFESRKAGVLVVVENRRGCDTEFFLISADSGDETARAAVEGVRSLRFLSAPGDVPFLFAVDGMAAFPEMEDGRFFTTVPAALPSLYRLFTGGSLASLLDYLAGRLVVTVNTGEGGLLEVDTRLVHTLAEEWSAGGIDRKIVIDPGSVLTGEEVVTSCDDYLRQRIRIEAVVGDGRGMPAGIVTEIDLDNRVALFSGLPGERCGTMILLQDVGGFSFEVFAVESVESGGESSDLLLWSSGGSMVHFDGLAGELHWWKELPGFSGRRPLVAELDGDDSPEVIVFSPSGEIVVIDLVTGVTELRLRKTGAVITDLNAVDTDGDGLSEILAGFKDEGIYLVNPRLTGRTTGLDIALSGMEGLPGGQRE